MASTGSSLDADIAGITPEINPIKVESEKPKNMFQNERIKLKSPVKFEAIRAVTQTKNKPTTPPITAKTMASNKN
jgi:hypothetical protein